MDWRDPPPPRRGREGRVGAAGLVLIGALLGLALGLIYGWLINPVTVPSVPASQLSPAFKQEYLFLVSQSYAVEGDLEQAKTRLGALKEPDLRKFLSDQLTGFLREGRRPDEVQNLAALAKALGVEGQVISFFGPTPEPQTVTPTPETRVPAFTATSPPTLPPPPPPTFTPTPTQRPTRTPRPTATPIPAFRLLEQERACLGDEAVSRIEVETLDAFLDPLPGIEVLVSWQGGSDRFYTGFKPAFGAGYGDFEMEKGVSYSVSLAGGSPQINGLQLQRCPVSAGGLEGGWRLTFQRLAIDPTNEPDDENEE